MTGDELATALTSGGSAWLVLSIAAILPILWSFAMVLHFARPYVIRFLQTLTLRFGGDVWWLSLRAHPRRPAHHRPRDERDHAHAEPVHRARPAVDAPFAVVLLLWAMVVKLIRDADDDPAAFRLVSGLLVAASVLYIVPQIYGLEAADQVEWLDQYGLGWIPGALSASSGDPAVVNSWAWPILIISLVLFGLTAAALFVRYLLGLGRVSAPVEAPAAK